MDEESFGKTWSFLSKNPIRHGCSKHIDARFHFLCDLNRDGDGVIELKHCVTQGQGANIMTKPLKLNAFIKLRESMGMCGVHE